MSDKGVNIEHYQTQSAQNVASRFGGASSRNYTGQAMPTITGKTDILSLPEGFRSEALKKKFGIVFGE